MHVGLCLLTLLPGRVGGSETLVRALLREFASGNGPERVTVLANRAAVDSLAAFDSPAVTVRAARWYRPGRSAATRFAAMSTAHLVSAPARRDLPKDADVLHYPLTVPLPRPSGPTVVSLHDVQHHDMPAFFNPLERRMRRWAYDDAARAASVVTTLSAFSRERIVERLGLDPARIEVIPLGIDGQRFRPEAGARDDELLAAFGLPSRFVIYPANLWPHKNHRVLLEALRQVDDPIPLILTGATYGRDAELQKIAAEMSVEDRVRHLGHVPHEALPALLRRATFMVFPSLYEGFGAPPLEAMACGCPVAASTQPAVAETCAGAAELFDAGSPDAIAAAWDRLAKDDGLRKRLSEAGLERVRRYSWERTAAGYVGAYERAFREGSPPRSLRMTR